MEDLKEKIEEIINKIKGDENILNNFKENPIKTVEQLLDVDLPDEQIMNIVEAVKAKINIDEASGLLGKIKDLF